MGKGFLLIQAFNQSAMECRRHLFQCNLVTLTAVFIPLMLDAFEVVFSINSISGFSQFMDAFFCFYHTME